MGTESATRRPVWASPPVLGDGWGASAGSRIRALLARPCTSWKLAALAIVVLLPTVWSGLAVDDFFQRLVVEGRLVTSSRLDLFDFISSKSAERARFAELGVYPWWIGPHTQVSYWRPVAALTHYADYALWPRAAWLMHLENLAWYGALVLAAAAFYRRFISVAWVAGFATACYAFDHAHAYPAAWVANRNALMSAFFGILSVIFHRRWRSERRLFAGAAAWAAFAVALLCAEAGLGIVGYTAAYVFVFERGLRPRALSAAPYTAIVVGWRFAYRSLGHGAVGSGANLDPLLDTGAFVVHALQAGPLLLASEVVALPPELLFQHPGWMAVATLSALALLGLLAYTTAPLFRNDRASRFFAVGAILSVVPLGGTFPSDRYLFWAGLGVIGLIAQLAGGIFGERRRPASPLRCAVCWACILVRGVASPALFPFRAAGPGLVEDDYERMIESIPRGNDFAHKTVLVLNAPIDLFGMCLPIVAIAKGEPTPAHMYMLYAGRDDVTVFRAGPRVVEVASERGWLARFADRLFRSTPLARGDTVELAAMTAEVASVTRDGRPDRVRFSFPVDVDDPSLVFLSWGRHGFERVEPPPANATLTVAAAPLFVADVMRPHIRRRAVENDQLFWSAP